MKRIGIIGKNISYSFSKKYFTEKFRTETISDTVYEIHDLQAIEEVNSVFELPDLIGLNVTIPLKNQIISFLDELDPVSEEIGAVNCIRIENGRKVGYNTDAFGFEKSLKPFLDNRSVNALVLGSGGASKAVVYVLNKMNIPYQLVSRKGEFTYADIDQRIMENHQLIINCTPLGTFPNVEEKPLLPYEYVTSDYMLYDLTYNPETTAFLQMGLNKNSKIKNGYEMLVLQAEKSWEIWNQSL